jgi:predicted dehydrogenase/NADPH:quinone reductase-like Zn-dependent oxidoreductase
MLVAKIPSANVEFESAAFTTLGAVAMHGVRTAEAKLGDTVAVIGLGLLGQLTVQILKAAGCRVIGFDLLQARADLARTSGALAGSASEAEFRDLCQQHSACNGVDSVLITAETSSNGPVNLASQVARDRGIVVAVGAVGMDLERRLYYEKELDFRISRSYGPGRYDTAFEQKGRDYPIGYVRWTETRNMEAFLQLLSDGDIDVHPLITHSFEIEEAESAYKLITGAIGEPYLGVLIRYSQAREPVTRLQIVSRPADGKVSRLGIGVLGSGNFALGTLIPAVRAISDAHLEGICASNGARAQSAAKKFGFTFCTTDEQEIYATEAINTIVIATRHHLHAEQVIRGLRSGKNVFCEKPLCLTEEELNEIEAVYNRQVGSARLMVGFNRRFAPMAKRIKSFLAGSQGPLVMHYRVNAGMLPKDHWINYPEQGGGRILGEVCHFVDFLSFLCGATPVAVQATAIPRSFEEQDAIIQIDFSDGSSGTIHYVCSGDRAAGKERVEVFGGGAAAILDDFRMLELSRNGRKRVERSRFSQDKGHRAEWQEFARAICSGGPAPMEFEEIYATTLTTIRITQALRSGEKENVARDQANAVAAPHVS